MLNYHPRRVSNLVIQRLCNSVDVSTCDKIPSRIEVNSSLKRDLTFVASHWRIIFHVGDGILKGLICGPRLGQPGGLAGLMGLLGGLIIILNTLKDVITFSQALAGPCRLHPLHHILSPHTME